MGVWPRDLTETTPAQHLGIVENDVFVGCKLVRVRVTVYRRHLRTAQTLLQKHRDVTVAEVMRAVVRESCRDTGVPDRAAERRLAVLRAIVQDYVQTSEPVGSKALVARLSLGGSGATVRLELAWLTMQWASRKPMGLTALPAEAMAVSPRRRVAWLLGREEKLPRRREFLRYRRRAPPDRARENRKRRL